MQMIFCPNCCQLRGFKRALGFGTLFAAVLTCGLWLLAIPFYPQRCIQCGLTRRSAWWYSMTPQQRKIVGAAGIVAGLVILGFAIFSRENFNPGTADKWCAFHSCSLTSSPSQPSDSPSRLEPDQHSVAQAAATDEGGPPSGSSASPAPVANSVAVSADGPPAHDWHVVSIEKVPYLSGWLANPMYVRVVTVMNDSPEPAIFRGQIEFQNAGGVVQSRTILMNDRSHNPSKAFTEQVPDNPLEAFSVQVPRESEGVLTGMPTTDHQSQRMVVKLCRVSQTSQDCDSFDQDGKISSVDHGDAAGESKNLLEAPEIRKVEQRLFGERAAEIAGYSTGSTRFADSRDRAGQYHRLAVIEFCQPHACDDHGGIVTEDILSGRGEAAGILYDGSEAVVYLGDYGYKENLPSELQSWMANEGSTKNFQYVWAK
jgi:hypothetical protein